MIFGGVVAAAVGAKVKFGDHAENRGCSWPGLILLSRNMVLICSRRKLSSIGSSRIFGLEASAIRDCRFLLSFVILCI